MAMQNWTTGMARCGLALSVACLVHAGGLQDVASWGYQLQGRNGKPLKIADIVAHPFDLMVIDYSADGSEGEEFSAADIAEVKASGKIVLAYMSIGEAEDYRFYWNWMPAEVIIEENPDWPGNYKVKYWETAWKDIIFGVTSGAHRSYLDRIIDQGFDGVYLDIVDAYEYVGPEELGGNDLRRTAAEDMINFVGEIADYARTSRGMSGFLVVPQNGSSIWNKENFPDDPDPKQKSKVMRAQYFADIDAIGVEDVFFRGRKDENNKYRPDQWVIKHLKKYLAAGEVVLSVEYLTRKRKVKKYHKKANKLGYLPLATKRDLDGQFFAP